MDKKGDKILSIYWFAILFIVAAGIVYMVGNFYGKPYDVRGLETEALMNRVADCVSQAGYINPKILDADFEKSFLADCHLNFTTEDVYGWNDQGQYYVGINVTNFTNSDLMNFIEVGNQNLKPYCKNGGGGNSPVCLQRELYAIDAQNNQYKISITSIVRKTEKNVQ